MKHILTMLLLGVSLLEAAGQQPWLWPIEGRSAGEEILYAPQQYIGRELNLATLFIGGREGDHVVAPSDATVHRFGFVRCHTLTYMDAFSVDERHPVAEQPEVLAAAAKADPGSITGSISLQLADGRRIDLQGIRFDRRFKTGDRIRRGEVLGTLHRSYGAIRRPSLAVNVSEAGRVGDPMTSFGLQSTFLRPEEAVVKEWLTAEEATADFAKILGVLREACPAVAEVVTPERLAAFEREVTDSLAGGIRRDRFYRHLMRLQALVHDSHLILYPDEQRRPGGYMPSLFFGWIGDSCVVTMARREHAAQVGRRIVRVFDMTADSARRNVLSNLGVYDAAVESVAEERLAFASTMVENDRCDQTFTFADGETRTFRGVRSSGAAADFTQTYLGYLNRNRSPKGLEQHRMIDDSTAYLGLAAFGLDEVTTDRIVGFIDSIARRAVPNLVVDLRNNGGGEVTVLNRILACFLEAPSRNKGAMNVVPKRGGYASFEGCCLNYTPEMEIFGDYVPLPDGSGCFSTEGCEQVQPDPTVRYRGRIYVLTDAGSASAATLFPAEILRNRRGVVVGRETATAYHAMTALKFADIRLPNSGFRFSVPLVRCIYDTTRNERIPRGRGVLPDYPVALTHREIFEAPDSILHYALQLIAEGRYFTGEDPFAANDAALRPQRRAGLWIALCAALGAGVTCLLRRRA